MPRLKRRTSRYPYLNGPRGAPFHAHSPSDGVGQDKVTINFGRLTTVLIVAMLSNHFMKSLDLTWPTAAENLACDEALLDACERNDPPEILRLWEPRQHFVVLGYANKAEVEINIQACRERSIAIFRRCSGGGAVLQGPGCLNYSLLLKTDRTSALESITGTNCFIMQRNAAALSSLLGQPVSVEGFTDLALNGLKFSGNAQRRRRDWILFHGTFLLELDISLMAQVLLPPSKQPPYRQNRSHADFLTGLKLPVASVKAALQQSWAATEPLLEIPRSRIAELVRDKYSRAEWNLKG